jgi:rubredoxin
MTDNLNQIAADIRLLMSQIMRLGAADLTFALIRLAERVETFHDQPIDMVLHCPACGVQHIDRDEGQHVAPHPTGALWRNPPHRSHLCHGCGHVWRPADVPTNGVAAVKTRGKNDSPIKEKT